MKQRNKRVLAVEAHPDDVEFMCSGILTLLRNEGYEISICCVANGDCGSMLETPERILMIRREEAIKSAKLLDAEFYPLGEQDLKIYFDDRTRMKVTECIRKVDPLIIFTHPHEDYMADHEITSRLVRDACFAAAIPNYFTFSVTPQSRISTIPYLYYWSPFEGKNIYGEFIDQRIYIDISSVIDMKEKMLACHKSQRDWLLERHGIDKYIEWMKNTAKKYGEVSGFGYAEGYTQHRGNAYLQDNILKEILGGRVKERAV